MPLMADFFEDENLKNSLKSIPNILVNLDPTIGSEMKKTRLCLIISPNEMNKYLQTIIIAPMTTNSKPHSKRVEIKDNNTTGWVVLDQIRTKYRVRIVKCFDIITD
jgi:mRNA interferase MazF